MATFDAILTPGEQAVTKIAGLATGTSSSEQALGPNFMFAIVADGDFNLKFGAPGLGAAAVTDFLIPSKTIAVFDTGRQWTSIRVWNSSAGSINVYILPLSRI